MFCGVHTCISGRQRHEPYLVQLLYDMRLVVEQPSFRLVLLEADGTKKQMRITKQCAA
jgi:hypothetical protein